MEAPEISVLVPFHNVESWIGPCLTSLEKQTFQSWEAILVDDCSTDGSVRIAQDFVARDPRFRVIRHDINRGLGGARNTAAAAARGAYLLFLDSDDLLPLRAMEEMHALAIRNCADIVVGDFHEFNSGTNDPDVALTFPARPVFHAAFSDKPRVYSWRDFKGDYDLLMPSVFFTTCWGKLFRRDLWKSLDCHVPGDLRMAEDFIPVKKIFFSSKIIVSYPAAALLYRKRSGSATTRRSVKAFEILRAYPFAVEMFRQVGVADELHREIDQFFVRSFRDHMLNLLPYSKWWSFYARSAPVVARMRITQESGYLDYVNLRRWKDKSISGFLQFIRYWLRFFLKVKLKKYLH